MLVAPGDDCLHKPGVVCGPDRESRRPQVGPNHPVQPRHYTEDGRLFVLEFSQPYAWFRPFYYFYLKRLLPSIAAVVTGDRGAYEYLCGSIERYPDHAAMTAEILRAGGRSVEVKRMTLGSVALHIAVK